MVQLGFSRRSKWTEAELAWLSTARNAGTVIVQLAARFGVSSATIINKLAEARKACLPVADRKTADQATMKED